jgi:hypothetical protein
VNAVMTQIFIKHMSPLHLELSTLDLACDSIQLRYRLLQLHNFGNIEIIH